MKTLKKRLHSLRRKARAGTTLVEMVVTLLVFSILMSMVVAVLHPATKTFIRMQKLQYAQIILDNTIQELRGMVLEASGSGYVKIYAKCELNGTDQNTTTDLTVDSDGNGRGTDKGKALEFVNLDDYVLLISADGFPETHIYMGTTEIAKEENIEPGRLLVHYYIRSGNNKYLYKEQAAGNLAPNYIARAVTTVFADGYNKNGGSGPVSGYYMGNYLGIEFSYPDETVTDADGNKYYSHINVKVSLYDDPEREHLVVEDTAVLDFRYPIQRLDSVTAEEKPDPTTP